MNGIVDRYWAFVSGMVKKHRNHNNYEVVNSIGYILTEPHNVVRELYCRVWGYRQEFHYHQLNPSRLSAADKKCVPVLLLHGARSSQGDWLPLAEKLHNEYIGPVYTLNLETDKNKDLQHISDKIEEIRKQYNIPGFKIHVIGHSMGGKYATDLLKISPHTLGKVILMGCGIFTPSEFGNNIDKLYEIQGTRDFAIKGWEQPLTEGHRKEVIEGHVGILFSAEAHEQIVLWLNQHTKQS